MVVTDLKRTIYACRAVGLNQETNRQAYSEVRAQRMLKASHSNELGFGQVRGRLQPTNRCRRVANPIRCPGKEKTILISSHYCLIQL